MVAGINGGPVIFNAKTMNKILIVRVQDCKNGLRAGDVLMSILTQNEFAVDQDILIGSLMHLHRRFGHLHYETIISKAKDPASGILLKDELRSKCLACAQREKMKNKKSK